jgi:phospholipid/cholesterol/gamma-HCH transport system substrate-binding protein
MSLERLYQPPEIGAPGIRRGRRQRRDLVLSGLFVLAMAAVLVTVMLLNRPALFGSQVLHAYFLDATGLGRGIDVVLNGEVVGHLGAVKPVSADDVEPKDCPTSEQPRSAKLLCFRAKLHLQRRWQVPADSYAQLVPASFMGGYQIRIEPGLADETLSDGERICTRPRKPDLASQASEALTRLQAAIDDTIRPALVKLQQRVQELVAAMGHGADGEGGAAAAAGEGLAEVLQNLRDLSASLNRSVDADRVGSILASVDETSGNLATLSGVLKDRSAELGTAVERYTALGADLQGVVNEAGPAVTDSLDDVQYLLRELSAALAPILANLDTASRNLAALSGDLRRDPKSLLFESKPKEPVPWLER